MTPKEQAKSFYVQALMQGYNETIALEMAKFAVDKLINYGDFDRVSESFWIDVMDELESM
jgi:hypothetical protein